MPQLQEFRQRREATINTVRDEDRALWIAEVQWPLPGTKLGDGAVAEAPTIKDVLAKIAEQMEGPQP